MQTKSLPPHNYQIYGLHFQSPLPCPELPISTNSPDLYVVYDHVPRILPDRLDEGDFYQTSPDSILLSYDQTGRFLIEHGHKITIDPAPNAQENELRLFLLGSALGSIMLQRNWLPLHGSVVQVEDGAVAFLGPSGAGKSTLAWALREAGYPLLSDDLCVLPAPANPIVYPGYPQIKLWQETLQEVNVPSTSLQRVHTDLPKYRIPLRQGFHSTPLPLRRIYLLQPKADAPFTLQPLHGLTKLTALLYNTYRAELILGMKQKSSHFLACNTLATQVDVVRVSRPLRPFQLQPLVEMLQHDFRTLPPLKQNTSQHEKANASICP